MAKEEDIAAGSNTPANEVLEEIREKNGLFYLFLDNLNINAILKTIIYQVVEGCAGTSLVTTMPMAFSVFAILRTFWIKLK